MALVTSHVTTCPSLASRRNYRTSKAPLNVSGSKVSSMSRKTPSVKVFASSSDPPVRQALSGLVSTIYKATAGFQAVDPSLPPLWQGVKKLDKAAVADALRQGASPDQVDSSGDTPLLFIAREGHYKYPPTEIPALLVQSGANLEATDGSGKTALQVALLSGWQNIAELLIKNGANTNNVSSIKAQITCPDCKRIVTTYNL